MGRTDGSTANPGGEGAGTCYYVNRDRDDRQSQAMPASQPQAAYPPLPWRSPNAMLAHVVAHQTGDMLVDLTVRPPLSAAAPLFYTWTNGRVAAQASLLSLSQLTPTVIRYLGIYVVHL
jgi:hypothetical protein